MIDFNPCRFAQYMIGLGAVGLADDIQAQKGYKVLLCMQREDGGWVLPRHYEERRWTRSCPWSTYHATVALYCSKKGAYRGALIRGLEFLVWHLSTKEEHELKSFFYHGHSTVRELLMLTEFGVGLQKGAIRMILAYDDVRCGSGMLPIFRQADLETYPERRSHGLEGGEVSPVSLDRG